MVNLPCVCCFHTCCLTASAEQPCVLHAVVPHSDYKATLKSAPEAGIQSMSPHAEAMILSTRPYCFWDDQHSLGLLTLCLKALPPASFYGVRRRREGDGEGLSLSHRLCSQICLCVHRLYPGGYTGNQVTGW